MGDNLTRAEVYALIDAERTRQAARWPEFRHPLEAISVLAEEVGEAAKAFNDGEGAERLRAELVQVAAVAVKWLEGRR